MEDLREEIKSLIVRELQLEDVNAADIRTDAPIFGHDDGGNGLGLDSIDALELAIAVNRTFGLAIQPDDANHRQIFSSVNALADYIGNQKAKTA